MSEAERVPPEDGLRTSIPTEVGPVWAVPPLELFDAPALGSNDAMLFGCMRPEVSPLCPGLPAAEF